MDGIRAGSSQVDITPQLGHNLAGWIDIRPATRQDTPILAHVVAMASDDVKVVLITCDLVGIDAELRGRIETRLGAEFGVPPLHVFLLPSHNHFGPSVTGSYAGSSERTAQESAYREAVIEKLIAASAVAIGSMRPVDLAVGCGQETIYFRNSRFWRRDGTINWVGKLHLDFARDSGPFDPWMGVLRIADTQKRTVATLYNAACHANAAEEDGFSAISWDWPGYASQAVEQALGGNAFFLAGPCGNVHPVREGIAREMGQAIGTGILEAVHHGQVIESGRLEVAVREISVPARDFTGFDPRQIEMICSQIVDEGTRMKVQSIFMKVLDGLRNRKMPDHRLRVRVIALGGLALAFVPGELFAEFGLEIRRRSAFAHTFVVESLSESIGYVPTRKAYDEGGYQPAVGTRLAPGGGEAIQDAAIALLQQMHCAS